MTPYGCALCGVSKRGHGYRGMPGHFWSAPSDALIKQRMQARRLPPVDLRLVATLDDQPLVNLNTYTPGDAT